MFFILFVLENYVRYDCVDLHERKLVLMFDGDLLLASFHRLFL